MSFFKGVAESAKAAVKKSGEIVGVSKLNKQIDTEEEKIQATYVEMGKAVFDNYLKGNVDQAFALPCERIKASLEVIEDVKNQILRLRNKKLCPSCGTELDLEQPFCAHCGAKQEMPAPATAPGADAAAAAAKKKCPSCGTELDMKQVFCSSCGAKQEAAPPPPPPPVMKTCTSCNAEMEGTPAFCPSCGAKQ